MKLCVQNISMSFGNRNVLNGVSLYVESGRISVLMGTNGAGKTTLFNIITGFLQVMSGKILLDNDDIVGLEPYEIRLAGIGRTFQNLRLIEDLTAVENIMLAFPGQKGEKWWASLLLRRKVADERKMNEKKAEELLRTCFLDDVADVKAGYLSYGQQKLLNLACCIAGNAGVLLLDEPVAGVNTVYKEKLLQVIYGLKKEGKALLIIEHNSDFIEAVADDILFLHEGKIRKFGSYSEFRNDANVKNAYI